MNSRLRKLLLPLLRAVKEGRPISFRMRSAASQSLFLVQKGTSKQKGPSARLTRSTEKRKSHAEETAKIREAVFKRAGGKCEASFYSTAVDSEFRCPREAWQLDHWLSGSGRRRERQSVETCWALCFACHRERTHNDPSAMHWNRIFRLHCEQHGYPATAHIDHQPVRRAAP